MTTKVKNEPNIVTAPDILKDNMRKSRLSRSVVGNYAINNSADYDKRYKSAVAAFRRETSILLDFGSPLSSLLGTLRQEPIKMYILK
ncbi:MAG: hypothetical protein K2L88_03885, partial [Clostridiales bacterium]|nr:hypothetical protein [Clostridiales bacterium]